MKILIYGEYSGYCESLARGFIENNVEASVFSHSGDGFKEIKTKYSLNENKGFKGLFYLLKQMPLFLNYDIILITNPNFFTIFKGLGIIPLLVFIAKRKRMYLLCCGDDVEYIKSGERGILKKFIYSKCEYPQKKYFKKTIDKVVNYLCARFSRKIIPTMYDYETAWKHSKYSDKVVPCIPLACYLESKPIIKKLKSNDQINILHGVNRPTVKGSEAILSALERIAHDYPNVKVHTPTKLSRDEYISLFSSIDIAIDQCKSHSYGMNGIYSMMHGHILLASTDDLFNNSLNIKSSPIVSIVNNSDDIYNKLCDLISLSNNEIFNKKKESQNYAYKMHQHDLVAKKMINVFNE